MGEFFEPPVQEGTIAFQIPGRPEIPCSTYYKIVGELSSPVPPLIVLHGGPGAGHEYLLSFADLWPQYGIPVIFYDQIGCASSTHFPQFAGDKSFWQVSLFIAELENLIHHFEPELPHGFHLLGHSWGGMFGPDFASSQPKGLRKLILASGVASTELMVRSTEIRRSELPPQIRKVLEDCIKKLDFESPTFKEAQRVFNNTFLCREDPPPRMLLPSMKHLEEDKTVNKTLIGPSIHYLVGSQVGWTSIPRLSHITAPTLVYNSEYDTAHDVAQVPFFKLIPRVRWITFGGSHMCHLEGGGLREKVLKVVGEFLTE